MSHTLSMLARTGQALRAQSVDGDSTDQERRTIEVAYRLIELCVDRGVLPQIRATSSGEAIVVTPKVFPGFEPEETVELRHGPVVVECEQWCESWDQAVGLVKLALKASVSAPGWAPWFVELMRPLCEEDNDE